MSKENDNENPFEGFISHATHDGVVVAAEPPVVGAKPADGGGVGGDGAGGAYVVPDKGGDGSAPGEGAGEETEGADREAAAEAAETAAKAAEAAKEAAEDAKLITVAEAKKMAARAAQGRVNEQTKKQRAAERERDEYKARAEAAERGATPQKHTALTQPAEAGKDAAKPDPNDTKKYPYGQLDDAYIADMTTYSVNKAWAAKEAEVQSARQAEAAASRKQEQLQRAKSVKDAGVSKYPDFEEVVLASPVITEELTQDIHDLLLESEVGADIAYHLASNPKEAREVYAKTPREQGAYFGRLEARFTAKPAAEKQIEKPKVPQAPAPVQQPRGAGGKFTTAPDTSDFKAFEALVDSQS